MDTVGWDKLLKKAYPDIWEQLDNFIQNEKIN